MRIGAGAAERRARAPAPASVARWLRPLAAALLLASSPASGDEPAFEVAEIDEPGRAIAAEIADLDGDGHSDLLTVVSRGIPPAERREIRVRFGRAGGVPAAAEPWHSPLPVAAAAYDLGDLDGRPGAELLLLRDDGLAVLSLSGRSGQWSHVAVPGPTAAPVPDERGLDRFDLLRPELGPRRLLVPGLGRAWVLDADGTVQGAPAIGGRGNYFLPPRPGPLIGETELELYFDVPRLELGDVDGDGRADLVAASRHALRLFRQREDGRFPDAPDRVLPFGLLSEEDHVRNTGVVRTAVVDWDDDGRADLLVDHSSGGLLGAVTHTRLHRNRGGTWRMDAPDRVFESEGGYAMDQIVDLDGDGAPELLRIFVPLGVLDLAEVFLQRNVDVVATIHPRAAEGGFAAEPAFQRNLSIGVSFETMRPSGFLPTVEADLNGDGRRDLLGSGDGEAVEVWLGGPWRFGTRQVRQPLDTGGRAHFGDLDGDGLSDLVLYDPRRPEAPVRLLRNRGQLPR